MRVVNSLYSRRNSAEAPTIKVVADERTNSVLIAGEQSQRLRVSALIAHLDTPLESGGDTRVRYLHYADAEKIAPKLKEQITGIVQAVAGAAGVQGPITGGGTTAQAVAEKNAMVWADPANNALVITAPPRIMRMVMDIVDKLDIRRPQVLVEAIIAEVDVDKDAELGINWAAYSPAARCRSVPSSARSAARASWTWPRRSQNPANVTTTLLQGTTHWHRAHHGHGCQLRRHAARHPRGHQHQRRRHALGRHHGQPGGGAEGRAGGALRHRAVHQHDRVHRRHGEPLPDHPARGGGHDPQGHPHHLARKARR